MVWGTSFKRLKGTNFARYGNIRIFFQSTVRTDGGSRIGGGVGGGREGAREPEVAPEVIPSNESFHSHGGTPKLAG